MHNIANSKIKISFDPSIIYYSNHIGMNWESYKNTKHIWESYNSYHIAIVITTYIPMLLTLTWQGGSLQVSIKVR